MPRGGLELWTAWANLYTNSPHLASYSLIEISFSDQCGHLEQEKLSEWNWLRSGQFGAAAASNGRVLINKFRVTELLKDIF